MGESGYRLGVAIDRDHVAGALADPDGDIVAVTRHRMAAPSAVAALAEVVRTLTARDHAAARIDRVAFALTEVEERLRFPTAVADHGPVAVVRLGAATTAVPPVALWPPALRRKVVLATTCVAGGARLDGTAFEPFDEAALVSFARSVAGRVEAVAVTAVFANLTPEHELTAAAVLERELGGSVPIVLSHEMGGTGLLERENATVLQAALTVPASRDAPRMQGLIEEIGLGHAEMFFARNDGTVTALDYAAAHPLTHFDGAAAAAVRGAARLAGEQDALVALTREDGTPPVVCAVTGGLPRLTTGHTTVAGVPTSLRVIARVPAGEQGGPATDARVMAEAVDRAKTSPADLPLVLAGPGADELATTLPLRLTGTLGVRCPPWAAAAAAVGVATAPVGGEAERIISSRSGDDAVTREALSEAARAAAVRAGADPRRAEVTSFEEIALTYHSEPAVALRARAEGPPRPGVPPVAVPARTGGMTERDVS